MLKCDDKLILFNSLTKRMVSVSNKYVDEFKKVLENENSHHSAFGELCDFGFIITDKIHMEEEYVEEEYKKVCLGKTRLNVIILPTYKCNFRCTYCYESFPDVSMTKQTADQVYKFVEKLLNDYSSLEISWFGGEPMLEMDTIVYLSEKFKKLCKIQKKSYIANITTNGYLLTLENFKILLKCNIRTFQITIDGLKSTHDSYRHLENGDETYDTIIRNLKTISDNIKTGLFQIVIRTNITRELEKEIDSHISCINEHFGHDIRFKHVSRIAFSYKNSDIKPQLYNTEDYINSSFSKLPETVINSGNCSHFINSFKDFLNGQAFVCYAGKQSSLVIDPKGLLMKCTVCLDEDVNIIGDIWNGINESRLNKWLVREENVYCDCNCIHCKIYPICFGVSCPFDRFGEKHNQEKCINRNKDVLLYIKTLSQDSSICKNIDHYFQIATEGNP